MIIGLCGYTRSGKDEVAKWLMAKYSFVRVAFADAMREEELKSAASNAGLIVLNLKLKTH